MLSKARRSRTAIFSSVSIPLKGLTRSYIRPNVTSIFEEEQCLTV